MKSKLREAKLRETLRDRLGENRYQLWMGEHVALRPSGDQLEVLCHSKTEVDLLRRKYGGALLECVHTALGKDFGLKYSVQESIDEAVEKTLPSKASQSALPALDVKQSEPPKSRTTNKPSARPQARQRLRYTLDNFVEGNSNRLALTAVRTALESPGRFSPLLLFGSHGTGKSHLLDAAAAELRRHPARPQVLSLTAEQFTAEFMEALRTRSQASFRHKFRGVDALLFDNVSFFGTKQATIEEFLHTIDSITSRGGQVILTSVASPSELNAIHPGIAARVFGGLAAAIDLPDYDTRLGIVRAMAVRAKTTLPEAVIEMIAQQVVGSARLLAGAINRLVVTSMAERRPITPIIADMVLAEFCQQNTPQVKLTDIEKAVCEVFGVESSTLKSPKKSRVVTDPRMLALCLSRRYTRSGLAEISSFYNRRSHTAVLTAQKRLDTMIGKNAEVIVAEGACQVEEAMRRVEAVLRQA
ncbi:DnaA ATPase domain-containing protein [Adhaeretor mobilis]|nr:DnaA/Hda family protein [Adhaeretor mobilis]